MERRCPRVVELVFLAAGLWPLRPSAGAELILTNPNGVPRTGYATASLTRLGLAEKKIGKLIDRVTGKELPFQVQRGQLAIVA